MIRAPHHDVIHEIDETPGGQLYLVMAYYEGQVNTVLATRRSSEENRRYLPSAAIFDIPLSSKTIPSVSMKSRYA